MNFIRKCLTKETHLKNTTSKGPNQLMFLLGFSTIPFVLCLIMLCLIFKQIAKILLFLYYGRKFKGFVSSTDLYWAFETKECRSIVAFVMFLKCNTLGNTQVDGSGNLKRLLKEKIFDRPQDYPKLVSTKHKFFGYTYLLPHTYTLDDVVNVLEINNKKDTINEEEYKEIVNQLAYRPLPHNDTGLWEVHVCQKPMVSQKENEYLYPILFRIHHLVGDGAALVAFVGKVLADEMPDVYLNKMTTKKTEDSNQNKNAFAGYGRMLIIMLKKMWHFLLLIYEWMGSAIWFQHIRKKDFNALHGPKLTGEKIATWYREDEVKLVPLIKKIKNAVPKTVFSDVIYTALSASFTNYFKKTSLPIPETLVIGNAFVYASRNLSYDGPAILENNTSFSFLTVPTQTSPSLYDTLVKVGELNAELKRTLYIEITLWSLRFIVGILPEPLLAAATYLGGVTSAISNLPGSAKVKMLGGCDVRNFLFFALNRYRTGVAWSFLTFDDRLQMGLVVDKVLINKKEEVNTILQDFIKNLHLLDEEVEFKHGNKKNKAEEEALGTFVTRF